MDELIITVAPYPGEKQEEKFPGKLDLVEEVVRSANAGAAMAHLHVRDDEGLQTTDTSLFQSQVERIRERVPVVIEGSTGGAPEHTLAQRCVSFTVSGIEMGSLNLGSVNLWDGVYGNKLDDILFYARELHKRNLKPFLNVFDLSHIGTLGTLKKEKLVAEPYVVAFVFDIPNSLPYSDRFLKILRDELSGSEIVWFLTRHHAIGSKSFMRALEEGGHVRVGFEDGPFLSDGRRARSNAELVEDVVKAAGQVGRKVVNAERAREILGLSGLAR